MSLFMRIIFFGLSGIIAGILSWPFTELVIHYQETFGTLLVFNIVLGISVGLFMGGCFGASEGLISVSKEKIKNGIVMGMATGVIGGLAGFVAGQAALLYIGTTFFNSNLSFQRIGIPVSRAIGWATFGICIGVAHGIRSRSFGKVRNGIIGGFTGGISGGLAVEFIKIYSPGNIFARLVGLVLIGFLIGIFYGLVENRLARSTLSLLNGRFKGKEFPLTVRMTSIGRSGKTEIGINGYTNVADVHAEIKKVKNDFVLTDAGSKTGTFVNDDKTAGTKLRNGDIIRVGDAQFLYKKK
ncbi:MAG TPA: FHA domain-containing protein [Spirochaetes bacterium]|nr:FHA domain-containing protein [Spirochaetota bacterium]